MSDTLRMVLETITCQWNLDDPASYYEGKKLRVTGKVIRENDETRTRVEDPKQIKVVEQGE